MRQRKFKFLLVSLLIVSGLLFAGVEAQANFTAFKYSFSSSASIPPYPPAPTSGTWTYGFTQAGSSSTAIKNILLEIPAEVAAVATLKIQYYNPPSALLPITLSGSFYGPCVGDPDTRLGSNDCRFNVYKINPPSNSGFSGNFNIVINVSVSSLPPDTMLGSSKQVIQLKSTNSLPDSDLAEMPTFVAIPPPPQPSAMNATISANPSTIGYGAGFGGAHIECTNLTWNTTPNAEIVAISGVGMVRGSGPDVNPVNVCPKDNTTYKITAILGTLVVDNTTTVTVIPPPPPVIEASVETVEKKDETGAVTGYVTFYSMDGVLQCSCSTGPDKVADPILPYENACFDTNPKCTPASIADLIPPLVCIRVQTGPPSSGNTCTTEDSDLCYTFTTGDNKLYKCDIWALQTRDTIVEIGKKSCTCGWTTTRDRYGKTVSVWTCSGSTCAACSYKTCP